MLQWRPGGWEDAFVAQVGAERAPELLAEMFRAELPAVRGEADVFEILAKTLAAYGIGDADVEQIFADVWLRIEVPPETDDLIARLRARGLGVHLGTNQTLQRGAFMRTVLGFDRLFDVSCYSAELRVAKPDPAYFHTALALIGAEPAEVVFVDDKEDNVESARRVGLAAVHWHLSEGHEELFDRLAVHGVDLRESP